MCYVITYVNATRNRVSPIPMDPIAKRRASHVTALAASLVLAAGHAAAAPRVVATIPPIHALVAGVMAGIAAPALLLPGTVSPHSYALKPSDARRLAGADVIVAVGPTLESFLDRPLRHLARRARIVMLTRDAGIDLLTSFAHRGERSEDSHDPAAANPHIWLDPRNAIRIVDHVVTVLGEVDPEHRDRYRSNGAATKARLGTLDRSLDDTLSPIRAAPFMVAHDAYAYLVRRYRLNLVGAFHRTPEQAPGARHIASLRARMARLGVRCVFSAPQSASRAVAASARHAGGRAATLDPLGLGIAPGPQAYDRLMRRLAAALAGCLARR